MALKVGDIVKYRETPEWASKNKRKRKRPLMATVAELHPGRQCDVTVRLNTHRYHHVPSSNLMLVLPTERRWNTPVYGGYDEYGVRAS